MKFIIICLIVAFSIAHPLFLENKVTSIGDLFTKDYSKIAQSIYDAVKNNATLHHSTFNRLAYVVDTFGPRLWGTVQLEMAIKHMYKQMKEEGFQNAKMERIDNMSHWVRGEESLTLFSPRLVPQKLNLIGVGLTVAGDITGEVIVVQDFEELEKRKDDVVGKIVLLNAKFTNYDVTSKYRFKGPAKVAQFGGIACLVRSITPFSISSVHGGATEYDENYPKIPGAAITLEDADMFQRMQDRGQTIIVNLKLSGHFAEPRTTYNLVGDIIGSENPEQIILMGGHIDSWDTGSQTGANDDGAGFMVCFEALRTLLKMGLKPKRTIRFIAWSGEEEGLPMQGAITYIKQHQTELDNHVLVFESDEGTTLLQGFGFTGKPKATEIMKHIITNFLKPINASEFSELGAMIDNGYYNTMADVPVAKNLIKDTKNQDFYFTYHHSAGDSMTMLNPDELDSNVVGIAALVFTVADMEIALPRN